MFLHKLDIQNNKQPHEVKNIKKTIFQQKRSQRNCDASDSLSKKGHEKKTLIQFIAATADKNLIILVKVRKVRMHFYVNLLKCFACFRTDSPTFHKFQQVLHEIVTLRKKLK